MTTPRKPQVLFLPKWYPNRLDEFDGNFIENHARAIAPFADISVIFVHSDVLEGQKKYEIIESFPFGYPEIRVYFRKPMFRFLYLEKILIIYRYWKAQRKALKIYLKKYGNPDLVHVHVLTRSALLAYYLKRTKSIPYLISEHWSGYFEESGAYKGILKKTLTKIIVHNSSLVTTVSEYLKKAMQKHGLNGNYEVIPNVVPTDVFKPSIAISGKEIKRLIHVSTLDTVPKNLPKILQVIADISKRRNDFTFDIYGDGPDRQKMEKLTVDLNIGDIVTFHGNVSQNEVAIALAASDVLILFSLYENQPCVIIESWAAGIPVIAPNIGGIPEHLNAKRGISIKRNATDELETAINTVLDSKLDFSADELRDYAVKNFSEKTVGNAFFTAYLNILKNTKSLR